MLSAVSNLLKPQTQGLLKPYSQIGTRSHDQTYIAFIHTPLQCCEYWVDRTKLQCLRNGSDRVAWKALNTWNWMQQTCWKHVRWFPPISFRSTFPWYLFYYCFMKANKGGIEVSKMVFFAVFWWNSLELFCDRLKGGLQQYSYHSICWYFPWSYTQASLPSWAEVTQHNILTTQLQGGYSSVIYLVYFFV